eukprot:COSAG03_NODE_383_length_8326_cov_5.679713_6_plen_95_part_00
MMPREQAGTSSPNGAQRRGRLAELLSGGLEGSTPYARGEVCLQPIGCRRSITLRSGGAERQTETERDVQCGGGGRERAAQYEYTYLQAQYRLSA